MMVGRAKKQRDPEEIRSSLINLLANFKEDLKREDLREKVIALIPAYHELNKLGVSLMPEPYIPSARARILEYFRKYPFKIIEGDELVVVSGISEWARRVRELRVQFGWWIYSGVTLKEICADEYSEDEFLKITGIEGKNVKPDQYILMRVEEDREAALRWNTLNEIRKQKVGTKTKILQYFKKNVGHTVSGEELRYLAKDAKEWARRVRELRTEDGWPISTKNSGRDDLDVGVYLLEDDRQAYEHDRKIPDPVRVEVLERDHHQCTKCHWDRAKLQMGDPRKFLELHHEKPHVEGGENTAGNLITLCNVCHDEIHRH